jgi:hypothetical protein
LRFGEKIPEILHKALGIEAEGSMIGVRERASKNCGVFSLIGGKICFSILILALKKLSVPIE